MTYDFNKVMDVISAFNSETDYYGLLNIIITKMMEMTNADGGTLYVADEDLLRFCIVINKSLGTYQTANDEAAFPPLPLNNENTANISAYCAMKNETVYVDDVYNDDRFNFAGAKAFDKKMGYRAVSMLVLPLTTTSGDEPDVIGVIQLINALDKKTGRPVSFRDVYDPDILRAVANISANALANILYAKEIDDMLHSFVRVMTKAIDERSAYNKQHTVNVAALCEAFSEYLSEKYPPGHKLHFDKNRRDQLIMAAYLHDIGKIITPIEIMDKADRLGAEKDHILYRFEIKKQQLEISLLKNEITAEQHKTQTDRLAAALELILEYNTAPIMTDEDTARVKELSDIMYKDAAGAQKPVLTADNITSLCIKKGTLTDTERAVMQEHVSITERLLGNMKFNRYYKNVPLWAAGHHEFLDGTGYPKKPAHIGAEVCILTIMDIYDALIAADRPYKKAMTTGEAHKVLMDMANEGKLHAELAEIFIESGVWERINAAV